MARLVYIHRFVVEGTGEFPFDMLRSDQCWPASNAGDNIQKLAPHHRSEMLRTKRQITLCSISEPTEGRWASFQWPVVKVEGKTKLND